LEFKNQKIIAWLLNRSKEAQQTERKLFFERLNLELANEHKHITNKQFNTELYDTSCEMIDHNDLKFDQQENNNKKQILEEIGSKGMQVQPIEFETSYWLE